MLDWKTAIVSLSLLLLLAGCGGDNAITIQTKGMVFDRETLTVKAGQPVSLRVINRDGYAHAFDMDEFDIHAALAAKETLTFSFTPDKPGRYEFYCGTPGHKMAGMVGALVVE